MTGQACARRDPAYYTPPDLPPELRALGDEVRGGLGVGAAGKVGLLELTLAPSAGATRVVAQYQRAPLHVYRPIYLDPGRPDMAFVFAQQSGDGLVQGDRYRLDIDCVENAAAHITTQAPTKIFGSRDNFVTHVVNLRVGAGAYVEHLPDAMVPCRGSRIFQRTRVTADATSTVIFGETLWPGRVAYAEAHAYDLFWSETDVRRPDGKLLFTDRLRLRPEDGAVESLALLGGHAVVSSLYVLTTALEPANLVAGLRATLSDRFEIQAGVSALPNGCGVVVRLLGPTSVAVENALRAAWTAARIALIGIPPPDLRKG